MKIITYTLRVDKNDASSYYRDVSSFADKVLNSGLERTSHSVTKLKSFIFDQQLELLRTDEEYMLEMLTIGVLWLRYIDDAVVTSNLSKSVLSELANIRQKGRYLKYIVDPIRGILETFFLYSKHKHELVTEIQLSLENFEKLIEWLTATGEFIQEVKRLNNWCIYFRTLGKEEIYNSIISALSFAIWFEQESFYILGKYTENVDIFLESVSETYYGREDLIFCSRQRLEYHLNMVGAEIMNRAYRADFIKTKRKAILLPTCLRKRLTGTCKSHADEDILYCTGCDSGCMVNQIKKLGELYGYDVLIIPHESAAFSNSKIREGELGIIGVACITSLLAGGWKAKALGIPAQCVLLDYCGCSNHWDEMGFSTAIDMGHLERIMKSEE